MTMVTSTDALRSALLRGTPVVPGVAHGPALLARGEVSADGRRRLR